MSSRTATQVRQLFLDFFQRNGHTAVRSSPLVPVDPTLLFTNAGMVQFKDVFTGKQSLGFTRAASSQKCVRAGGKHNDLDNVGRTARHHTFFEMLGNFSFGDYFKEEAIRLAWELLHKELGLPRDRLIFTVFRGEDGIPADDEARDLWRRITGVSEDRVMGLGKKDNFWMMGDTGPQGPCSEIHFHQGDDLPCAEVAAGRPCLGPACDCDRWLEIWNLVFMQFERKEKDGPLLPLPAPSIDTGAGLERVSAVVQGQRSNYGTDLFQPLLQRVAAAAGKRYVDEYGSSASAEDATSMRVLADHGRAATFLIADGVHPSNLGRGYVLRRIMRRAIRHAVRLNLPAGFYAGLCGAVIDQMSEAFPELNQARALIEKFVQVEDEDFRKTIGRGLKMIGDYKDWGSRDGQRQLPGEAAFTLHDTYGFPLDLTQIIGQEQGFLVDEAGFDAEMKKQRERSAGSKLSTDKVTADVFFKLREEGGATAFTGYGRGDEGVSAEAKILALVVAGERVNRISVSAAGEPVQVEVLCDRTPFYGRAGGQTGDTGQISSASGAVLQVNDTHKPLSDLIVHQAALTAGSLAVGDAVTLKVDGERRDAIRRNHSATHLLHHALRHVLGSHVTQKGSYVGPDKLTFDFSHFQPLTPAERATVERLVNQAVLRNDDQDARETSFSEAQTLGAMALFGEKYGERVRVLRLGLSVELCGGTHVFRTGDIGLFKLQGEEGIAKGVRRITAVTGLGALEAMGALETELGRAAELLRSSPEQVAARVEKLQEDLKARDKEIGALKQRLLQAGGGGLFAAEQEVAGHKVLVRRVDLADPKALREAAEQLRDEHKAGAVVLAAVADGKVALVVAAQKELAGKDGRFHAGKLVGALATQLGGKGGGRPDIAQAGGNKPEQLDEVLAQTFALMQG